MSTNKKVKAKAKLTTMDNQKMDRGTDACRAHLGGTKEMEIRQTVSRQTTTTTTTSKGHFHSWTADHAHQIDYYIVSASWMPSRMLGL